MHNPAHHSSPLSVTLVVFILSPHLHGEIAGLSHGSTEEGLAATGAPCHLAQVLAEPELGHHEACDTRHLLEVTGGACAGWEGSEPNGRWGRPSSGHEGRGVGLLSA